MSAFFTVIKTASDRLSQHETGKLAHVMGLWDSITWIEHNDQMLDTDAELGRNNEPFVNLYPSLLKKATPEKEVLIEFGLYLLHKGGPRANALWEKKLAKPSKKHLDSIAARLADLEVRKTVETYEKFVSTLPATGYAVERIIAIHLLNALNHQNIAFKDSLGVDIFRWGPTNEFANGKKYYSLIPLTCYMPRRISSCFGCFFADWVLNDLNSVIETSVRHTLKEIGMNVLMRSA